MLEIIFTFLTVNEGEAEEPPVPPVPLEVDELGFVELLGLLAELLGLLAELPLALPAEPLLSDPEIRT